MKAILTAHNGLLRGVITIPEHWREIRVPVSEKLELCEVLNENTIKFPDLKTLVFEFKHMLDKDKAYYELDRIE